MVGTANTARKIVRLDGTAGVEWEPREATVTTERPRDIVGSDVPLVVVVVCVCVCVCVCASLSE